MKYRIIHFIYLIVFFKFIYPALIRYLFFPHLPRLFFELFVFVSFVYFYLKGTKINSFYKNKMLYNLITLFSIVLFSSILNGNNFILMVKALIEYFLLPFFISLSILSVKINNEDKEKIYRLIYFVLFMQIPVVIIQGLLYHGQLGDMCNGTIVSGDYGGTGIIAMLMNILFIFFYVKYLINKKLINILFMVLTLIPIIIGSARFGFVTIGISILLSPIILNKLKVLRMLHSTYGLIISIVIILMLFILIKDYLSNTQISGWDTAYSIFSNKEKIFEYGGLYDKQGRLGDYIYILSKQNVLAKKIFGLGGDYFIGSRSISIAGRGVNVLEAHTFGTRIVASLGLMGILFMFTFFFQLIRTLKNQIYLRSKLEQVITLNLIIFVFIIPLISIYVSFWNNQINLVLFILASTLLNFNYKDIRKINENITN